MSGESSREGAHPVDATELTDNRNGIERDTARSGSGKDRAPNGAVGDRHSAAAEATLDESALPQVADLADRGQTIDLTQQVGEDGAAAAAGASDIENSNRHESTWTLDRPGS